MKVARIYAPGDIRIENGKVPSVSKNEAIIKVKSCGICRTDVHVYEGVVSLSKFPVIPGHEICGTVYRLPDVDTQIKEGDIVTIDPNLFCGICHFCRRNR